MFFFSFSCSRLIHKYNLFKSAHISVLNSFQDDGLKHNNSIDFALWECGKIWSSNIISDVVLSLEIGKEDDTRSLKTSHFRHVFNDGFISRLCRSFMSILNGKRAWKNLTNRLNDNIKTDYFRFNIFISPKETFIENPNHMNDLRKCVHLLFHGLENRINATSALLTANFYFELQTIPNFENGNYACHGIIRCRNDCDQVLKFFEIYYSVQSEFLINASFFEQLSSSDICTNCHTYAKKTNFYVKQLEDIVTIKLKLNAHDRRKISEFSRSMLWFIKQQKLDAVFGTFHHDSPRISRCHMCFGFQSTSTEQISTKKKMHECVTANRKRSRMRWHGKQIQNHQSSLINRHTNHYISHHINHHINRLINLHHINNVKLGSCCEDGKQMFWFKEIFKLMFQLE